MSVPMPSINIELGIADTIRAINEIYQHPKDQLTKKQDESLSALRQQLDIVFTVVTKLEDLYIEILRGFKDEDVLKNPDALKAHVTQTEVFLESKKLLPFLEKGMGAIDNVAFDPKFEGADYQRMIQGLRDLRGKLYSFRHALGRGGYTAPGLWQLIQLCALAKQQLATNGPVNQEIAETAKRAFDEYDWSLSSDIRRLIGYVTLNS